MQKHKLLSRKKNRKSWTGFEMICINDDIKPQTKKHFGNRERGILRAYMSLGSVSRLIEFYSQKELKLSSQASHFTAEGRGLDVIYSG